MVAWFSSGGKELLLGLEHGGVGRVAAVELEPREPRVLGERAHQPALGRELVAELRVRHERVLDVGERVLDRELVGGERRLLRGLGLRDLPGDRAAGEDRADDRAAVAPHARRAP